MRILLDIGAHFGQTTEIALNPVWGFDEIHAFEPSTKAFKKLSQLRSRKLHLHHFGLYSENTVLDLIGSGEVGASIYDKKIRSVENQSIEKISLVDAEKWVRENLDFKSNQVYLKLNCEGSEVDILRVLIDSKLIDKFKSIYIDFDIRKIPGEAYRRVDIESELITMGINFSTWEELIESLTKFEKNVPYFTFTKWLLNEIPPQKISKTSMLLFKLKFHLSFERIFRSVIRELTPRVILNIYRKRRR